MAVTILSSKRKQQILTISIAAVWLVNGLFCKVLNMVPRHQEIVASILGSGHARLLTVLIGLSEIAMAVWIFTGWFTRLNAIVQMGIITVMNTLEFFIAPDLLLWGRLNALWAFLLVLVIYYNEFQLAKK